MYKTLNEHLTKSLLAAVAVTAVSASATAQTPIAEIPSLKTELGVLKDKRTDLENAHKGITSTKKQLNQYHTAHRGKVTRWRRRVTAFTANLNRYKAKVRYHKTYCRGTFQKAEYERRLRWCRNNERVLGPWKRNLTVLNNQLVAKQNYLHRRAAWLSRVTKQWVASVKRYARAKARFQARLRVAVQRVRVLAVRYGVARCRGVRTREGAHHCLAVIWDRANQSADRNVPVKPPFKATPN